MADVSQGSGWWQASDGRWYAPDQKPTQGLTWSAPGLAQPVGSVPAESALGKDRSPGAVLALSIVTLGVYYLIWYYQINDEIRRHDPDIDVSPTLAVLAISIGAVLFFIPPLVSSYATAARIRQMQLDDGASDTISPVVALLLHIFLGIGYPLYLASQLREHWHGHRRSGATTVAPKVA